MSVSLIDGHIDDDVMTFEALIGELEKVRYNVTSEYHKTVIDAAIDTLQSQKAEIERLEEAIGQREADIEMFTDIGKMYSELKAEAIKEFVERLKEEINTRTTYSREQDKNILFYIDNLVKEMVGEIDV